MGGVRVLCLLSGRLCCVVCYVSFYLKRHTEIGGGIDVNEIELQCLEGDQCGEYTVKFILDGLPMKRGVVNKKWREYVAEDATCGENDRRIRREVVVR